jgi:cytoskeleton protein RodZ
VPKNVSRERVPPRKSDDPSPVAESAAAGGAVAGGKRPNRPPPWEKETVSTESGTFGDWLRRQREVREISLRDIAERTKISFRYLEAMEADRFDLLPAPVFAKGFLREYARYVGLSPDDVVNHYLSEHHPEELAGDPKEDNTKVRARTKPLDSGPPPMRRNWSGGLLLGLAGLILLVLVGLAAWFADHRRDDRRDGPQAPPMTAPAPGPAAVQPAAPARPSPPPPSAPIQVSLDFGKDCWVEAVIDGGKHRFSELRVQGESLPLEAEKSIVLTLGNAGAVDIQVNGYPLPLNKKDGDVVHDLVIDLGTVQALKAKKEAR